MEYAVHRALHINKLIINIGDEVLIQTKDKKFLCVVNFITWLDEYNAALMTNRGTIDLRDVVSIVKITKA